MFSGVLWKTEIYDNAQEEIRVQAFKYLRKIYLQNSKYYFGLFDVKNIVDLLVSNI